MIRTCVQGSLLNYADNEHHALVWLDLGLPSMPKTQDHKQAIPNGFDHASTLLTDDEQHALVWLDFQWTFFRVLFYLSSGLFDSSKTRFCLIRPTTFTNYYSIAIVQTKYSHDNLRQSHSIS
jgi:hypothetical protein